MGTKKTPKPCPAPLKLQDKSGKCPKTAPFTQPSRTVAGKTCCRKTRPKEAPVQIAGPHSVTEHSTPAMTVLVFGEIHGTTTDCAPSTSQNIVEFLRDAFRKNEATGRTIDFFLEEEFMAEALDVGEHYLHRLRAWASDCLRRRDTCEFKATRFHYADVRFGVIRNAITAVLMVEHTDYAAIANAFEAHRETFIMMLRRQAKRDSREYARGVLRLMKSTPSFRIVQKEVERSTLTKSKLVDIVAGWHGKGSLSYMRKDAQNLLDTIFWPGFNDWRDTFPRRWKVFLSRLWVSGLDFLTHVMDLYTVCRIFKRFADGYVPTHVVTYAGEAHAGHLRQALQQLGFTQTAAGNNVGKACVAIDLPPTLF